VRLRPPLIIAYMYFHWCIIFSF